MATMNQIGLALSGASGTGSFVGTTSPTLTTPRMAQINDASGNPAIALTAIGSANYWAFSNSAALGQISVTAAGSDTDIAVTHNTKGTGQFKVVSGNSTQPIVINSGTGGQHVTTFQMANTASATTVTFPDSSGTLLMTGQAISTVPSIAFSSTTGIVGTTTNNNADTGSVGEYVESIVTFGSAVSFTSGITRNITSITLSAGDWDVWGNIGFTGNTTTSVTVLHGTFTTSSTSANVEFLRLVDIYEPASLIFSIGARSMPPPPQRFSLSGTSTVYLTATATFTVSTCSGYGFIAARRRR